MNEINAWSAVAAIVMATISSRSPRRAGRRLSVSEIDMSLERYVTSDSYGALRRLQIVEFNLYEV